MNRQAEAESLIRDAFEQRARVAERLRDLPETDRQRICIAHPNLTTYGAGKDTGLMIQHAGAINVAAQEITGYRQGLGLPDAGSAGARRTVACS